MELPRLWPLLALCLVCVVHAADYGVELRVEPLTGGRNLLPNPSFEKVTGGVPDGYHWSRNTATGVLSIVHPGHSGQNALHITNTTPFGPNIFSQLSLASEVTVKPHTLYTLSFFTRSDGSPGAAWVGGGQGWNWRMGVPETHGKWLRVSRAFVTGDETSVPIMINTDSETTGFDIDDVQLEAGPLSPFDDPAGPAAGSLDLLPATAPRPDSARPATWASSLYPNDEWAFGDGHLELLGVVGLAQASPEARVELRVMDGGTVLGSGVTPAGLPARAQIRVDVTLPANRPSRLTFEARLLGGDAVRPAARTLRIVGRQEVEALLAAAEAALPPLEARAEKEDDARAVATTVRWFIGWTRDDLAHKAVDRAYDTALRLEPMVKAALAAPLRPNAPRYVTSPLTIDGPCFQGERQLPDGTTSQGPLWFVGLGHFNQVQNMVEQFPKIGVNIIQFEIGPSEVMTSENGFNDAPIRRELAVFDRAAKAGVSINLLLSPHYFPQWALAKWPDINWPNADGFLKYDIQDPRAKSVIERFLRHVIPMFKDHPALHSLCLSNEPVCIDQHRSPTATAMWRAWLKSRYATVNTVNARWGTTYADFDAIPIPPAQWRSTPLVYDYTLFNQEAFTGWHAWMAGIIHEMAPKVPVHAKIMMSAHFGGGFAGPWCNAPELYAAATEINGNDCCKWPGVSGEWACEWIGENMGYDYQRSAADKPVFNSENHVITDRDLQPVSPAFIRNAYWQGALHGQGATTTWVWERDYDPKSDFQGSIMCRPECTASLGLTALDLMREAAEMRALADAPAPIAVLWSQASLILGRNHLTATQQAYVAANFLGVPVGFVNERDCEAAAAGKQDRALDAAQLLIVPAASHVPDAVIEALKRFSARGGKVLLLGDESLRHDDAGRERPASGYETWPRAEAKALWEKLAAIAPAGVVPVRAWGVEARSVAFGGRRLVNLCNYGRASATVTLPAAGRDVLRGADVGPQVVVEPLTPRLIALP
jgi:hypothetical protein